MTGHQKYIQFSGNMVQSPLLKTATLSWHIRQTLYFQNWGGKIPVCPFRVKRTAFIFNFTCIILQISTDSLSR